MRKGKKINLGRTAEGFLISLGISFLLIILFSLISALTLGMLDNPTRHIGTFALAAMILAAATGGLCSTAIRGEKDIRHSALISLATVLIMLLINVILSSGRVSGSAFMNYGCYYGVFLLSSLIKISRKTKRRRK